ncbi:MAG: serine/threonine protein kinase, partial [Thermoguttaceae bacterium]|nr:serine/threonine protein kinase [Thermoguttaceae bacterium]
MSNESSEHEFSAQETQICSFVPNAASHESDLDLETILERFTEEIRQGKKPSVEEYAERYSEYSEDIRDLFPTLLILEKGGEREALHQYTTAVGSKGILPPKREELKNYEIHRELGRGGMGIVYEAYDKTLERLVALKVMKIFPGEEEQSIKRFQREARMAAKLHHTNIVPVYDYEVFDNQFFYAMQLIEGVSLEQFLRAKEKEASQTLEVGSKNSRLSKRLKNRRNKTPYENDSQQEEKVQESDARADVDRYFQRMRRQEQTSFDAPNAKEDTTVMELDASPLKTAPTPEPVDAAPTSNDSAEHTSKNDLNKTIGTKSSEANEESSQKKNKRQRRAKKTIAVSPGDGLPSSEKGLLSVQIASSNYYQQICDVGIQAANALEYAHRHNVLHRDVKPSNLIVDNDGVVWITDFGLAKPIGDASLTKDGQIVGTLRYLAPESVVNNDFSPSSDVFSLGLTLYELLTFTPAYDKTGQSLIEQASKGTIVRPRKINPHIPRDLETIILKTLETPKDKRYASAGELADDLQRFLDERPIRARRAFLLERAWRLCKRNKIVASLSAALVLLGIATIVTLAFMISNEKRLVFERGENFQEAQNAIDSIFQIIT